MIGKRILFLVILVSLLYLGFGNVAQGDMTLDITGSGLGQPLTISMTGPANESYILLMSLTTGPTTTPWITLDVGLELLTFSATIPGFMGYFDGSGNKVLPLGAPNDPALHGFNLNFQNCLLNNMGTPILDKSNLYRVTFQTPNTFLYTLNVLEEKIAMAAAATLDDGNVLLAGGIIEVAGNQNASDAMFLYRPNLEAFEQLSCTLPAPCTEMIPIKLQDGRVLLLGGIDNAGDPAGSAWIFDPSTNTVSNAGPGVMPQPRMFFEAVLLDDGRVLIVGGTTDLTDEIAMYENLLDTTLIYDPGANSFSSGATMGDPRGGFSATKLNNGKVLVAGGVSYYVFLGIKIPIILDKAQVYTPNSGAGSFGSNKSMGIVRGAHKAQLLSDGKVLIISGGTGTFLNYTLTNSCEIFNPAGETFSNTGSMIEGRVWPSLTLLPDGKVIVMGGGTGDIVNYDIEGTSELYNPATGTWSAGPDLLIPRFRAGSVWLPDGSFLLAGGLTGTSASALDTAEIYQP